MYAGLWVSDFLLPRSIFRSIELLDGWSGKIAEDEPLFLILDALLMVSTEYWTCHSVVAKLMLYPLLGPVRLDLDHRLPGIYPSFPTEEERVDHGNEAKRR